MNSAIREIFVYSLIPAVSALLGALIAALYQARLGVIAALQHLVAGIVIGAVCFELIPKILGHDLPLTISLGFIAGVVVMLLLECLGRAMRRLADKKPSYPLGLLVAGCIDLFIDGVIIGIAFVAGLRSGLTVAISLSLCAFLLNLTLGVVLKDRHEGGWSRFFTALLIAIMLPLGGLVGGYLMNYLSSILLAEMLSFAVAALLYLGVEELLGQAHQSEDATLVSMLFFVGFFLVLIFQV